VGRVGVSWCAVRLYFSQPCCVWLYSAFSLQSLCRCFIQFFCEGGRDVSWKAVLSQSWQRLSVYCTPDVFFLICRCLLYMSALYLLMLLSLRSHA